jgi:hypothetical protein
VKKLKRKIVVDEYTTVSSVWAVPEDFRAGQADALILAHGAGNDMNHPFLSFVHESLAAEGWLTIRFNFPYKEQGKKAPDVAAKLERTFRAVLLQARNDEALKPRRLFIGGKSLGGRIASQLAAQGEDVAGLVFLGYPLHPPAQPAKLRVAQLKDISCPMLFISGSKDPFCQLNHLKQTLKSLKRRTNLYIIEEGDHSFQVPQHTGRTEKDVWREIVSVISRWLKQV